MKHNVASILPSSLFIAAALLIGCGDKDAANDAEHDGNLTTDSAAISSDAGTPSTPAADASASWTAAYPGTEDGAKQMLAEFLKPGADHATLSKALQPTTADYAAVFSDAEFAKKAETVYGGAWSSGALVVAPNPGQTEVRITSSTTDELKAGTGNAAQFPGGYKDVADKYNNGLAVYSFEFVEAGKDAGMSFDGLVHVNGAWRIFPKPWRIAEG